METNKKKVPQEVLDLAKVEYENLDKDLNPSFDFDKAIPAPSRKGNKDQYVSLRVTSEQKSELEKYAKKSHKSLTAAILDLAFDSLRSNKNVSQLKLKQIAQIINS